MDSETSVLQSLRIFNFKFLLKYVIVLALLSLLYVHFKQISAILNLDRFFDFSATEIYFDEIDDSLSEKILNLIELPKNKNIFTYDIIKIKQQIEKIDWVKSVVIQRKLPNILNIRVIPRVPVALLQKNYSLYFCDESGITFEINERIERDNFPIIIGENVEDKIKGFLTCLQDFPNIKKQITFGVWTGNRRWDIHLRSGKIIKFAENRLRYGLKLLSTITTQNCNLDPAISCIDFRIIDRIIVKKTQNNSKTDK